MLSMDADVALLQEAGSIPPDVEPHIEVPDHDPWEPWDSDKYDRYPMIVRLSDRVKIDWFKPVMPDHQGWEEAGNEIAVSDIGTIAAVRVIPQDGQDEFIAVSMYARWLGCQPSVTDSEYTSIYSDRSAHRIISDLSAFIDSTDPSTHRILAAGDLNMIYGATEDSRLEILARARTITDRMDALGMETIWGPNIQVAEGRVQRPQMSPQIPGMCLPTTPPGALPPPRRTS